MREMTLEEMRMVTGGWSYGPDSSPPDKQPPERQTCPPPPTPDAFQEVIDSISAHNYFTALGKAVSGAPEIFGAYLDRAMHTLFDSSNNSEKSSSPEKEAPKKEAPKK